MLLLSSKEGAFERPKVIMGLRQLPRQGQLWVGDADHIRGLYPGVSQDQRPRSMLMRYVLFGLDGPDSAALVAVGLGHSHRLMDELSAIAFVDACFVVSVDLALVVVVYVGTC